MESIRIGIAGYMGSGKSSFARELTRYDVEVIDGDIEAKEFMLSSPFIKEALAQAFGEQVLTPVGIDFGALGIASFQSFENLLTLNRIVHPPLLERLVSRLTQDEFPRYALDAALLPLWDAGNLFDARVWVKAPFEARLERTVCRSDGDPQEVRRRMELQQRLFVEPQALPWIVVENTARVERLALFAEALVDRLTTQRE